jgi:hypothetical protein
VLKVPIPQTWSGGHDKDKNEDKVHVFLPRLAQYFKSQNLREKDYLANVLPFLKGNAFQQWNLKAGIFTQEKVTHLGELYLLHEKDIWKPRT